MNIPSTQGAEVRKKIMDFLKGREVKIVPVSFEEIAKGVGISSTSVVAYHLNILERKGDIRRDKNKFRHIQIVKKTT